MNERMDLSIRMELMSDAIFGAGFSIPGGEDISVYTDSEGYPFFKGSSLKGLLRESLENLLIWNGQPPRAADRYLGQEDWAGVDSDPRVYLSDLTLTEKPDEPDLCFGRRAFTALQDGVVKEGSLREAVCVRRGAVFSGRLSCRSEDAALLQEALALIKWAGASRNRGFGRVRLTAEPAAQEVRISAPADAVCLRYVLRTELPLIITKLSASAGNGYETRNYIPGSVVRGMVAGALSRSDPAWFSAHMPQLLGEGTRFLNALPVRGGRTAIPSLMGFYEDKAEENFTSVIRDEAFPAGFKRAKVGSFCAPGEDGTLCFWSTDTDGRTRIDCRRLRDDETGKNVTGMFQTRHICAGQEFEGYILLEDPSFTERISSAFTPEIWIGADRFEGFGRCRVTALEAVPAPACEEAYGYAPCDEPGPVLYMTALSPVTMLDASGEPCGLCLEQLARDLGVSSVSLDRCSTSVSEYGSYNRTWECREPAVRMYDSGSLFRLIAEPAPTAEALLHVQRTGLGIRRAEGYGRVLFLRRDLFENLVRKESLGAPLAARRSTAAALRRSRMRWIMENAPTVPGLGLSNSQLGSLQALCEQDIAAGDGAASRLLAYLDREAGKNAVSEQSYRGIRQLIDPVLKKPLSATLGAVNAPDEPTEKLRLLCELFDHSRKVKGG